MGVAPLENSILYNSNIIFACNENREAEAEAEAEEPLELRR